jgi:hypothetical protein
MLPRLLRALGLAVAVAAVLTVVALTRADVDLWGHLRFGLDILEARSLESVDPYSFTSDRPWINHEWLSEVLIALAWQAAGAPGLILVKLACAFGALALMASALGMKGVTGRPRIMLLGLMLIGILPRITHVRPQLFSVVLFAALVHIIVKSDVRSDRGSMRTLLWFVPVLVLWANLHGGWLVGVGTVGLWCIGESWKKCPGAWVPMCLSAFVPVAIALVATAATLLNPYGIGLWTFLFETVRFGREGISEWGPAWNNLTTMIVWGCFAVLTATAIRGISRDSGLGARDSELIAQRRDSGLGNPTTASTRSSRWRSSVF